MDYATMLARAKKELPEVQSGGERFEIPKVKGHVQGNKTIISNFPFIVDSFHRPAPHILKFLNKELAAKGKIVKEKFLIFNTKLPASRINEKVSQYAERYVICRECGKPDTKIEKKGQVLMLRCMACGTSYAIKSKG